MTIDLKFYWKLLLRRAPAMAAILLLCSGIGIALAIKLPTTYASSAKLLVESAQLPGNLATTTVNIDAAEQLEIIRQRLMTRANLIDIANELNVFENRSEMTSAEVVREMRSRTGMRSAGRPLIMTISFKARNGKIAADVVNKYITLILDANTRFRTGSAQETLQFFEQDVNRLDNELALQSSKILNFKIENADALPEGESYNRNRQAQLQERQARLLREEADLVAQRARLADVFERTGQVAAQQRQLSPNEQRLQQLQNQMENALVLYSPENPNIRILRARIEKLEAEVAEEKGATDDADTDGQTRLFEVSIAEIDGRIEAIRGEVDEILNQLREVNDVLEETPRNAIALQSLERDYSSISGQYNAAVSRLAQARMGERIEDSQRGQRISLIEPASVSNRPASPNRPVIAAAGVGTGMMLAIALYILLEIANRTVRRPYEIESALGITPIATIPYMETTMHRIVRRSARIVTLVVVIVSVPALLWAVDTYYQPLDLLFERVLDQVGL